MISNFTSAPPPRAEDVELYNSELWGEGWEGVKQCALRAHLYPFITNFILAMRKSAFIFSTMSQIW